MEPNDYVLTVKAVSQLIGCSLSKAYMLVKTEIPSMRIGPKKGSIRVSSSGLEQYKARCLVR